MLALYDGIGRNYAEFGRTEHRIASAIDAALGYAKSVVNIGAGTGSSTFMNTLRPKTFHTG